MGSFYATCSVTRKTITDGQEMYVQLMVPHRWTKLNHSNGNNELSPKAMIVSDEGACRDWIPFGPAIRGVYDDCGKIKPLTDEDSQNRVMILEKLFKLPFDTIMKVARDTRWFTYGLGEDKTSWKIKGVDKDMPEWQLLLCKKVSLTYFHASVYDELTKYDFSADDKNGVMKSKYTTKWKNEHIDEFKNSMDRAKKLFNGNRDKDSFIHDMLIIRSRTIFSKMDENILIPYFYHIVTEDVALDWMFETVNLIFSMSNMCIPFQQSEYGSQHQNWYGWKRLNAALEPKIDETIREYGYEEDDDWDDEDNQDNNENI